MPPLTVSGFMLVFDPLGFEVFLQSDKHGSICILLHADIVRAATFVEDVFFFPLYSLALFVKNHMSLFLGL